MRLSPISTRSTTRLCIWLAVLTTVALARAEDGAKAGKANTAAKGDSTTSAAPAPIVTQSGQVVLRENLYYYDAFNRRDPFRSLIDGAFNQSDRMDVVNLNVVQLVGIVRGEVDRFALLEDASGYSYILRVGDRVHNGSVVSIGQDDLVARVTNFGQTTTVRLRLVGR